MSQAVAYSAQDPRRLTMGLDLNNDGRVDQLNAGPLGVDVDNDGTVDLVITPEQLRAIALERGIPVGAYAARAAMTGPAAAASQAVEVPVTAARILPSQQPLPVDAVPVSTVPAATPAYLAAPVAAATAPSYPALAQLPSYSVLPCGSREVHLQPMLQQPAAVVLQTAPAHLAPQPVPTNPLPVQPALQPVPSNLVQQAPLSYALVQRAMPPQPVPSYPLLQVAPSHPVAQPVTIHAAPTPESSDRVVQVQPIFAPAPAVQQVVHEPVYVDRIVEKPVYVEREVEKPVYVERVVEKPVYIERVVERPAEPIYIDRVVERPAEPIYIDRVVEREVEKPVPIEKERSVYEQFGVNVRVVKLAPPPPPDTTFPYHHPLPDRGCDFVRHRLPATSDDALLEFAT